tara:strand:+ start:537 stop:875 length:339 start_codon:yes stop_codon:yes gene_type:complete
MAESKMSDALERARARSASDEVAAKRRAILDPDVGAFIKVGAADSTAPIVESTIRPASRANSDAQLNTRIPADLYQRARRAVFECQMSKTEPSTIQDLVSQALQSELKRLGF